MKKKIFILFLFLVLVGGANFVNAGENVNMYFFWGDGCPHCAKAKPFIEQLKKEYPQLKVSMYEIYYNKSNAELFDSMISAYGAEDEVTGVPAFFIGEEAFAGYSESMQNKFRQLIENCIKSGCSSPMNKLTDLKSENNNEKNSTPLNNAEEQKNSGSGFVFGVIIIFFIWLIYHLFIRKMNNV